MRIILGLALAIIWAAATAAAQPPAAAGQEPAIAPAPEWVQPAEIGAPDPALRDRAFQILLTNSQSLFGADHIDHYFDAAFLIQDMQALQGFGNIVIPGNWTRATHNFELEQALADCEQGVARAPDNPAILDSRAFVRLRLGQIDGAIADASAALERAPQHAASLYVRGVARLRKGERDAGARDLAAARRLVFDIDAIYGAYGVTP